MTAIYINPESEILSALSLASETLDVSITSHRDDADIILEAHPSFDGRTAFSLNGNHASVEYSLGIPSALRAIARLLLYFRQGIPRSEMSESPTVDKVGAMLDNSRNAVMNVPTVKKMLLHMALLGMNTCMLYTEDTYELPGYPYFGYMRGRYTSDELRELDRFALTLGIELIPCIQTLGHLATYLGWGVTAAYKDTENALLVGAEETYELIGRMLDTVSACFTTRRVHVGLDEARDIGTGKYLVLNGLRERSDILTEHVARVTEMARSRGLSPMMWSDMFFRIASKGIPGYRDYDLRVNLPSDIGDRVPEGMAQVFWDYYHEDESFYTENIEKHRKNLHSEPIFAGGVYTWSGHCPLYNLTRKYSFPALRACKDSGVREILATVWHSGSEGSLVLSLPALAWYADFAYVGEYNETSVADSFRAACHEDINELLSLELPEHPEGGEWSLSRSLLYNDPLLGLADKHIEGYDPGEYYRRTTSQLEGLGIGGIFSSAYRLILDLSRLLIHKADFGKRLYAAYRIGDREALSALASECDVITALIDSLTASHRTAWMEYNKPFGWEVHDIRYGGLKARFATVRARIEDYLAGRITEIGELCEQRLRIDSKPETDPAYSVAFTGIKYRSYATVNIL